MTKRPLYIPDTSPAGALAAPEEPTSLRRLCDSLVGTLSDRSMRGRVDLRILDERSRRLVGDEYVRCEGSRTSDDRRVRNWSRPPLFEVEIESTVEFDDPDLVALIIDKAEQDWIRILGVEAEDVRRELGERQRLDRRIACRLADVADTGELAGAIEELVSEIVEVEFTGFYFVDPQDDMLKLGFARGLEDWEIEAAESTAWKRHPGLVIRKGITIDIEDTDRDEAQLTSTSARSNEIRSRLYLPVRSGDRVIGALGLASSEARAFSDRHRDIMGFLTGIAGLAWERINQSHKRATREQMLKVTASISSRLVVSPDWRETIPACMLTLGHVIHANWACFVEFDLNVANPAPHLLGSWPEAACGPARVEDCIEKSERLRQGEIIVEATEAAHDDSVIRHTREVIITGPVIVKGNLKGALVVEIPNMTEDQQDTATATIKTICDSIASCATRCELESALRHAQKLEAVGSLAGGIAHDLNNLLAPILNCAQILERHRLTDQQRDLVTDITYSTERAAEIVGHILEMSRKSDSNPTCNDIAEVIREGVGFYERTMPKTVRIETSIDDVGLVEIDKSAVHQIMLNLCTNACQAMSGGGRIEIRLERCSGSEAVLSVSDEGEGMDDYTATHMFDPYFTTKTKSGGSGLGLAIVQRILGEVGARAEIQSSPGAGTTIRIILPLSSLRRPLEDEETDGPSVEADRKTVFIVDDNAKYLKVSSSMITHFGHEVETFTSGRDLLSRMERDDADPDVVVTDLSMPGMDGISITRAIKALDPSIPVICCTGFGSDGARQEAKRAGVNEFVQKPVDMDALERLIADAIASRSGSDGR